MPFGSATLIFCMLNMDERIAILVKKIFEVNELYTKPISIEYDRMDLFLPEVEMSAKRLCEYMLAQERQFWVLIRLKEL